MSGERESVLRFCADRRADMERLFHKKGRYESPSGNAFCAFVHMRRLPESMGTTLLEKPRWMMIDLPAFYRVLRPGDRNTDIFGEMLREVCEKTEALGFFVASESWIKSYGEPGMTLEEVQCLRRKDPKSLGDAKGAKEALIMSLEHSLVGRRLWVSEIQRNPTRLLPWKMEDMAGSPMGMRLSGIMNVGN